MWTYKGLKRRYNKRIMALMGNIAKVCNDAGLYATEPYDDSDDEYSYGLMVERNKDDKPEDRVGITFTICESSERDGSENGVNFCVDIVEYNGRMLGDLCPFNYSPEVWASLDNIDAIDARFAIMERADISGIPELVKG